MSRDASPPPRGRGEKNDAQQYRPHAIIQTQRVTDAQQNCPQRRCRTRARLPGKKRKLETRAEIARIRLMNPRVVERKPERAVLKITDEEIKKYRERGKQKIQEQTTSGRRTRGWRVHDRFTLASKQTRRRARARRQPKSPAPAAGAFLQTRAAARAPTRSTVWKLNAGSPARSRQNRTRAVGRARLV